MNAYRTAVDPLEALGDATRRAIVASLRDGERTVGDLAAGLPVSRPAVSQHLAVLRAAGLLLERPQGTRRYYRLDPAALGALHDRIDAMWGTTAAAAAPVRPLEPIAAGETETTGVPADVAKAGRKKRKKKSGRK